ncbi:hypothetical protein DJ71_02290, partial [Halorubrum sp. E3]
SAAQLGVFSGAAESAAGSSVRANLAGLSGPLTRVGAVAAAATPAVLGLGSALGGVAGFSGLGGLAAGGLTAAGIQARAEEMAAFSTELEDAAAAREELFANFKGQLADAFEPIQNADVTQQFALRNLEAVVDVAEDASTSLQAVDDTVIGVASGLREAAVATSPAAFAALADQTERLAPLFSRLDSSISQTPQLINFLGSAAQRVGPDLFQLGAAAIPVAAGLAEVGLAASDVLLPPLNASLFVLGGLLSTFEMLPAPLQNAAVAFTVAAAGAGLLAGGVITLSGALATLQTVAAPLIGTVTVLGGVVSAPIWAVAALAGAVAGLITYFGWWDNISQAIIGTWNGFVDILELGVNGILWASEAISELTNGFIAFVPGIGTAIYLLGNLDTIITKAGQTADWLGAKFVWLAKVADKYLGWVLDLLDRTSDKSEELGGVSFEGAKFGDDGDDSGDGSSGPDGGGPGSPPPSGAAPTTGRSSGGDQSVNIDTLVVEDRSGNAEQTADKVIKRLEKRGRREGGHPTG